jgi:hypothetical protein
LLCSIRDGFIHQIAAPNGRGALFSLLGEPTPAVAGALSDNKQLSAFAKNQRVTLMFGERLIDSILGANQLAVQEARRLDRSIFNDLLSLKMAIP